jgi:RNA polymerase sigma factor (sigma-70 family)
MYGIASNVVRAHLRARKPQATASASFVVDWDAVDERLDASARRGSLRRALDCLSDRDRELLLLVAWEQLTPADAGAVLGLSSTAARTRLHRARARAQAALQASEDPSLREALR